MKKFTVIFSFIFMMAILLIPTSAWAKETSKSGTIYGTITVNESEWTQSVDTYSITQVYSITKSSEYIYFNINPVLNVGDVEIIASSSAFTIVSKTAQSDGSINVLLKATNGTGVSTKTEAFTVVAKIIDPSKKECNLSYSPLSLACAVIDNIYFDDSGKTVTEAEYNEVCGNGNTTPNNPDEPNPETGSVIPYIAVGGGLLAIAGVYLYSRKSSKFYKI